MSEKKPKAAGAKPAPAVVVPEPKPSPGVRPSPPKLEPAPAPPAVIVLGGEPVIVDRPTLRSALERIAGGRMCGCHGAHDGQHVADCPKSIAREALK